MKRRTMLTALALAVGGSQLSPRSRALTAGGTGADLVPQQQDVPPVERAFNVSREQRLVVRLETGGGLDIVGVDHDVVAVKLLPGGRDWKDCKFEAEETADGVEITSRYAGTQKSYSTSLRFQIMVPRRFSVEIESNGGDIQINGVEGRISGRTMGGGMVLTELKGEVDLTTMGGDVTVADSELDGQVSTMSGAVLIRDTRGDIKGSSAGGRVLYRNVLDRSGKLIGE